ncbi:MAG: ABC transporter permease subunit [Acidimicrobiia bacterium]|nr:ABC transporter permease subunit [Acidimicrobiia bacterium]
MVGVLFLASPVMALLLRAPWSTLGEDLSAGWNPLMLSIAVSSVATLIALIVGLPLAWLMSRSTSVWVQVTRGLLLVPIVLPPVVSGVALTAAYGRRGMFGSVAERVGIALSFTTAGAVVAVLFVSMPLLVLAAEAGFRQLDPGYLDMGKTLGLRPWERMRRIVLPMSRNAILAGAALTWSRAIGEFGATITFAGNRPQVTQTLPLAVFLGLERGIDEAVALSLLAVAVAVAAAAITRLGWLRT